MGESRPRGRGDGDFTTRQTQAIDLYRSGVSRNSQRGIALKMGVSSSTIHRWLKRAGVKARKRKVQKPARIVLLLERSALARIREVVGRGKVNEWIRKVIDEAL